MIELANIIGYILAIPGFLSVAYLLWKRFNKDIKLFSISASYNMDDTENPEFKHIDITINMGFVNNSEQNVAITDIVGVIKYNKEMYNNTLARARDIPDIPYSYSVRPYNFDSLNNFSIASHGSINKEISFVFKNMIYRMIERMGPAHFMGFLKGSNTAIYHVYETEVLKDWSKNPLQMLLIFHIDGKQIFHTYIPVHHKDILSYVSGTLDPSKLEKIKIQDFQYNKVNLKK